MNAIIHPSQRGFTFLEILIALLILSIGLLAIASLQFISLKNIQQSLYYSIAQTQLVSMIERVRANPSNISDECAEWNNENKRLLPSGVGECHCSQNNCEIVLTWKNKQMKMQIFR